MSLNQLSKRTGDIVAAVGEAQMLVGVDLWCNGYGILADPNRVRLDLAAAHAKVGEALKLLRETQWPRDDEYDALEREHNQEPLKECDCCGKMKPDVESVFIAHAGDTSACADCRNAG
jgi:hypothetical protein